MEDPRTKSNAFRVPSYNSQNWETMLADGTCTIKDMVKALDVEEESLPSKTGKAKTGRSCRRHSAKLKAVTDSDLSDLVNDNSAKTSGVQGVKSASKPKPQSSEMELKSIITDGTLLMSERVESRQTEHYEHHRAKLSGVKDIRQSKVSSSPEATTKFGVTWSAAQVLKDLNYTIPRLDSASDVQSTSK